MNRHNSSIEIVADGLHMPECPRWHDEHLWFSDIRGDTVYRVDDGHVSVVHRFPDGEEPAGPGWLPNGDLLVAGMAAALISVLVIDISAWTYQTSRDSWCLPSREI